jgi:hypothetical protein
VLIIAIAGFVFFNTKSGEVDFGDEKNGLYHGTVENKVDIITSLNDECYDEK